LTIRGQLVQDIGENHCPERYGSGPGYRGDRMDLRLDVTDHDGIEVLSVHGEVDVSTAPRLRQQLVETASSGHDSVVVDLDSVEFLDSTGLGVLVSGLKRFRTQGGDLHLVCNPPRILRVFEITGLTKVFAIHPTVDDAVSAARG
jgi:anti-sigma B factor antagonist